MKRDAAPAAVLVAAKPEGPTSREVVDLAVRVLGTRRVGHAGTLDPFASGVLLVAWGRATGLVPYLQQYPKTYEASVRFGRITDTQDRTGAVLEERNPASVTEAAVRRALEPFRGTIMQVPPMFSALKHDGRRLHELARAGTTVERAGRERTVHELELLEFAPPVARLRVVCSAGTYVRTLAHDLGEALGPGASLDALSRTAIGPHRLAAALPAGRILALTRAELLERALAPSEALPDWPAVSLSPGEAREVLNGSWRDPGGRLAGIERARLLDREGRLLALASGGGSVRLLRVFGEREEAR